MLMQQVTHGAIQFTAYEELRKVLVNFRSERSVLISSSAELLVINFISQIFLNLRIISNPWMYARAHEYLFIFKV